MTSWLIDNQTPLNQDVFILSKKIEKPLKKMNQRHNFFNLQHILLFNIGWF